MNRNANPANGGGTDRPRKDDAVAMDASKFKPGGDAAAFNVAQVRHAANRDGLTLKFAT